MSTGKIVVGLIWGDEGKGITTDFLCKENPESTIVVRYSGGQQAGHNVEIDGVSHIHSNFGSGTLRGVPSFFSHHCTVYPVTIFREGVELNDKTNRKIELYLHPLVNVTTPADVAYNRITAPKTNHGSCGIGVGATMKRNIETPYKVYGIDLRHQEILKQKIESIYKYYRSMSGDRITQFDEIYKEELGYFEEYMTKIHWNFASYDYFKGTKYRNFIFEGSQGILLDMDHGIFPHVTYANTTSKNAIEIAKKLGINDIEIFYVTRCYQTRHGEGWMSNNEEIKLINNENETNKFNEWQKEFRIGEIDYDLLNQSLDIDNIYSEGLTKNLVVTCLDQRENFKFDYDKLQIYFDKVINSHSPDSKDFVVLQNVNHLFPWP